MHRILASVHMIVLVLSASHFSDAAEPLAQTLTAALPIRDPFVVADSETRTYFMYGTRMRKAGGPGFDVYISHDLEKWETVSAFERPKDFWADRDFWAPEVHRHRDVLEMVDPMRGGQNGEAAADQRPGQDQQLAAIGGH